jgi:demethoxyubiquinone hydroxylase (CLK1/Coq7/Cat5 family)
MHIHSTFCVHIIAFCSDDELNHHQTGIQYHGLEAQFYDLLKTVIQTGCKAAICVTQKI